MRTPALSPTCLALALALVSCRSTAGIDKGEALAARSVEMQVDSSGRLTEIEYHLAPDQVPESIRRAMDALHPGGPFSDAEREFQGGRLYYELNRAVAGREVEAMFTADGRLHSEELQVGAEQVPDAVRATVRALHPSGTVTQYEEIRDGERALVEYHVKLREGERKLKVLLSPAGRHLATYREIEAEIEVPID